MLQDQTSTIVMMSPMHTTASMLQEAAILHSSHLTKTTVSSMMSLWEGDHPIFMVSVMHDDFRIIFIVSRSALFLVTVCIILCHVNHVRFVLDAMA